MDRQELRQEWCQALKSGEVIATFWAIMTHPAADAAMQKDIYGDIHMLSHMSGASNRADLKHLQTLQSEQLALHAEIKHWKQNSHKKHTEIESLKQEIIDQEKTIQFYEKKFESLQAINEQLIKLNSADLVICPTNCISHNAYWQIKKSCKKQNKPCKFIPSSGLSSLSNTLEGFLSQDEEGIAH